MFVDMTDCASDQIIQITDKALQPFNAGRIRFDKVPGIFCITLWWKLGLKPSCTKPETMQSSYNNSASSHSDKYTKYLLLPF